MRFKHNFKSFWRFIRKNLKFCTVFIVTLALVFLSIFWGIIPVKQNFEGNLLVKSFSFTCQENESLLLKDVYNLSQIDLSGLKKFTLAGTFSSLADPELNKRERLEIESIRENSTLTITPTADFILQELRLQKETRVKNLKYAPFNNRLAFSLQPNSQPVNLSFNPSSTPIKITLSGYKIANLPQKKEDIPLEFNLSTTEFKLELQQAIDVNLQLSQDKEQLSPDQEQPIFWRNIKVNNVRFERPIITGNNVRDDLVESTIISGNIRMAQQDLKLEENQFLIVEKPGVEILNQIKIIREDSNQNLKLKTTGENLQITEASQGLEVSVSGNTNSIQVGLNPRLPIAQIQGSFLSRYLANKAIVAIISFSGGLIVSLLSWLFDNFPASP
ncbi:MAG: hypothetical protein EWV85_14980 [Microcystis aeruginosa Ma_QC_C_20070703_M131]|uniref:Uncharacterized protein n=1 Tax=Microcystis aeruginosa Ma_QC_C_20070703_M131 TaxID=2486263 RepID=A0A551XVT6_MICAE|nr:MAG: hypothetical protein EWV85_14980 [Microcystis aeruginosa Ma_QC_C_20070703_M131]